jgi:hypothetical protein
MYHCTTNHHVIVYARQTIVKRRFVDKTILEFRLKPISSYNRRACLNISFSFTLMTATRIGPQ